MSTRPIYIAVPAWGEPYVTIALRYTIPAVLASLAAACASATFIVHTNERSIFRASMPNQHIQFGAVVRGPGSDQESNWRAFERAHRDAIERTPDGALLILLNADIVCSVEMIAAVNAALRGEKKVGLAVGLRTLIDPNTSPPIGTDADTLSAWIWQRRHPIIRELLWGAGKSDVPTMLFFAHPGGGISMHCFHLAPMFIVKDRELRFSSTIDDDLVENNYAENELFLFRNREFVLAEMSPANKGHGASRPLTVAGVLEFTKRWHMRPSHLRNFRHRFKVLEESSENHNDADAIIAGLPIEPKANGPVPRRRLLESRPPSWFVSVPVWGAEYVAMCREIVLPRLADAIEHMGLPVTLVVHTDTPDAFRATKSFDVETWPMPQNGQWFEKMSAAHADVINNARPGDTVVLLTADMIVSRNALAACNARFNEGKRMVVCAPTRVIAGRSLPPIDASSRELSEWGWQNRHRIIRDCTWPDGTIEDPCRVYFEHGRNVVCRLWLPHPIAYRVDGRAMPFGPTIDCNLFNNYHPGELHVVTQPDELAVLNLEPECKRFGARDANEPPPRTDLGPISSRYGRGKQLDPPVYRWLVSRRIVVSGTGNGCADLAVMETAKAFQEGEMS